MWRAMAQFFDDTKAAFSCGVTDVAQTMTKQEKKDFN